jgi:transcription initiation factor IIF auxiliary subunit
MQLENENQSNMTPESMPAANANYEKAQSVLKRLKALNKKQKHVAKRFNRSKGRVSQAFAGQAPDFMRRIEIWVAQLEQEKANKLNNKLVA